LWYMLMLTFCPSVVLTVVCDDKSPFKCKESVGYICLVYDKNKVSFRTAHTHSLAAEHTVPLGPMMLVNIDVRIKC
jgi:hypothetical protein